MKKLLGIVVLGLFLTNSSFAEVIKLKCIMKSQDQEYPDNDEIGKATYWNLNLKDEFFIVDDNFISSYLISNIGGDYSLIYQTLNRYDGALVTKSATVPDHIGEDYINYNKGERSIDVFNDIVETTDNWFIHNKYKSKEIYYLHESECSLLKKKF